MIGCFSNTYAQGDLFINPKRVVFEGTKLSQEISLANTGNDTARYVVSFVQIRLKDDGNFQVIEEPDSGQRFADKNLRLFPRTVRLGPKESQTVKIQVYQKNNLTAGEYRSHLYFRAVPSNKPLDGKKEQDSSKNVTVKLVPVYGITIPVIIRIGENSSKVAITALKLEQSAELGTTVSFRMNRTGNMSVYGNLNVDHISTSGKVTKAGFIKGISVYTPNTFREVQLKLDDKAIFDHHSGKIQVTFSNITNSKTEKIIPAELLLN